MNFLEYLLGNYSQIVSLFLEHIQLTVAAVGGAILFGVPLGIFISYARKLSKPVMGAVNIIQAIPSLALLGAAIPLLGIGKLPAIIVVLLYSLLPITKNTYTGISNINPDTIEAAQGIGLTGLQVLTKVQIPLALPIIMAGVRIAAVTAVGLMTIAAFIGAGGLGFLVFSGISTVNNNLILAGAIPACVLALLVDFIAGKVEKMVTPAGIQNSKKALPSKNNAVFKRWAVSLAALLATISISYHYIPLVGNTKDTVVVGGKDFTEQHILTHMLAELIEHNTDLKVERKVNLGGTQVCFAALRSEDLDIYVEYSGTAYADTLGYPPISDMEKVYQTVKKDFLTNFDIKVLQQMMFNNTYTLSTTQEIANEFNLKTISDLLPVASDMTTGLSFEFLNRDDGLPGLEKFYDFKFNTNHAINGSQRYIALANKNVQVIDAFATDGLLKKFNLLTLQDDKNFFPPYYAIPLIRTKTATAYPELVTLIEKMGTHLTDAVMTELNYRVDELQQNPRDVAISFLKEKELI